MKVTQVLVLALVSMAILPSISRGQVASAAPAATGAINVSVLITSGPGTEPPPGTPPPSPQPAASVSVSLSDDIVTRATLLTGPDGRCRFAAVPFGTWVLSAEVPYSLSQSQTVVLDDQHRSASVTLRATIMNP